jgi:hypothetical protein
MRDEWRVRLREVARDEGIRSCPGQEVDSALYASSHPKFVDRARKTRSHQEIESCGRNVCVLLTQYILEFAGAMLCSSP